MGTTEEAMAFADVARQLKEMEREAAFYRRRCEALAAWQRRMRDPERTVVRDILANGFTLNPPVPADRYELKEQASPAVQGFRAVVRLFASYDVHSVGACRVFPWHETEGEAREDMRSLCQNNFYNQGRIEQSR